MNRPKIMIGNVENLYVRFMYFEKAGDIEHGHYHDFDHLSLLSAGKIRITVNNKDTEFSAPRMIYIHKNYMHEIVALEDNTVVSCIHALRNISTGDIISPDMVPNGVPLPKDL